MNQVERKRVHAQVTETIDTLERVSQQLGQMIAPLESEANPDYKHINQQLKKTRKEAVDVNGSLSNSLMAIGLLIEQERAADGW